MKADRREAKRQSRRKHVPQHGKSSIFIIMSIMVKKGK